MPQSIFFPKSLFTATHLGREHLRLPKCARLAHFGSYPFSGGLSNYKADSLVLEVLHQALHIVKVGLQLHLVVAQAVELSAQVGNVGLEHGVDVGAGGGLALEEVPFGLQHFVLLFQEADLRGQSRSTCFFNFLLRMDESHTCAYSGFWQLLLFSKLASPDTEKKRF